MATFYIQLENKLLQISGDLTAENISKALGYVPVSPNVTNELSQRVDNITFDSLKDNPFLQDGSGELNIVDEAGNIIAKIDVDGIHSVDFIAGEHRLSDKTDKTYVDEVIKNVKVDLTGYATEEWVENKNYLTEHQDISHLATKEEVSNIDFYNINNNPIVNNGDGKLLFVDENGYIGLQLEENGLYVKDVIADGHTLSQKADKSELSNYATKDEVSDLVDMSVVNELQEKVNTLIDVDADKSVRDIAVDVLTETLVSETATEAYDTLAEMSAWIKSHPEDAAAMNIAIQKNATDIQSNATAISNLDAAYKAADAKVLTDANEYTDNINFYTIKDNPIVDGEAGSLTFVDETGYIGLKVTKDGIIAKDVVTSEHVLSNKADKSELPTKVSELTNDSGFITINDIPEVTVPTKVSELENDSKFITIDEVPEVTVPTKTSELTNDSGFITINDVPVLEIPDEYVTDEELSQKGFATEEWVNNNNYATEYELNNIEYSSIKNTPTSEDETGELNITDENGNIGMKVSSEAVYAKDFISGEHKLSEKVNKTYVDNSIAELVDGAPETLNTLNELSAALKDNADIVDVLNQSISSKQDKIDNLVIAEDVNEELDDIETNTYLKYVAQTLTEEQKSQARSNIGVDLTDYAKTEDLTDYAKKSNLSNVATSGSYNDLTNKPTILSESDVNNLIDTKIGDINSILESIINGDGETNVLTENIILYGLPTRASEYNYFYSQYPVESDVTITANWEHPINGEQVLVCHISKGNTKIDETLTMAYEFTKVVITPEKDSKYIYTYNI